MNDRLRARREATPSPSGSGAPMSRVELAAAVNEYVRVRTGRAGLLMGKEVGRYERGEVGWPSRLYREALRSVLKVRSDQDLGFFPRSRGPSVLSADVVARAVVRRDGSILTVRRRGQEWWSLPGGHVGSGESVEGVLLRELASQIGVPARIVGFAGVVECRDPEGETARRVISLAFETEVASLAEVGPSGDLELGWLRVVELAHHDLRPVALRKALVDGVGGPFWHARNH